MMKWSDIIATEWSSQERCHVRSKHPPKFILLFVLPECLLWKISNSFLSYKKNEKLAIHLPQKSLITLYISKNPNHNKFNEISWHNPSAHHIVQRKKKIFITKVSKNVTFILTTDLQAHNPDSFNRISKKNPPRSHPRSQTQ